MGCADTNVIRIDPPQLDALGDDGVEIYQHFIADMVEVEEILGYPIVLTEDAPIRAEHIKPVEPAFDGLYVPFGRCQHYIRGYTPKVLAHEIGHAHGLHHASDEREDALMYPNDPDGIELNDEEWDTFDRGVARLSRCI